MDKKTNKYIFWIPRIMAIVFILFLAMFSLDVFEEGATAWEIIVGLFMHNIPVFILIGILWIAWKYEIVGAIAFFIAGILYIITMAVNLFRDESFEWYMISYSLIIAGPAFIIGTLFLIGWKQKKK